MTKQSAKNSIILVNGYALSTQSMNYEAQPDAGKIDVTGFTDGCINYIPGVKTGPLTVEMFWDLDANKTWDALKTIATTGHVSILPQGGTTGNQAVTMPFLSINFNPHAAVSEAIKAGSIQFENYGSGTGIEFADVLYHGTITNTTTGTSVRDVSQLAATSTCGATIHCWGTPLATDTYVVKVQHSANNSTWADLLTFTVTGATRTAERVIATSGTVNQYRRVIATRTGAAGDSFGFTVLFWRGENAA